MPRGYDRQSLSKKQRKKMPRRKSGRRNRNAATSGDDLATLVGRIRHRTFGALDPAPFAPLTATPDHWPIPNDAGFSGGMNLHAAPMPLIELAQPFEHAFRVATSDGAPPSGEILQALNPPSWHSAANRWQGDPAFIARHRHAFSRLYPEQQQAIRNWTYLDVADGYASDDAYEDVNYELNRQLNHRRHDSRTAMRADDLQDGLSGLPTPEGSNRLIRTASVPGNYAGTLALGDYMTNSPAFMSASSENTFAEGMLAEGHPSGGTGHAFAIYDIQSRSATPFVGGITTMAGAEREWLFAPGTVFRVEELATATPLDGGALRIGVRLVEVPFDTPVYAKNIHTGMQELVYPRGTTPVYTPLQPTRSPTLQTPPQPSPTQPPLPAHGDPNRPGVSAV